MCVKREREYECLCFLRVFEERKKNGKDNKIENESKTKKD
jgi:hypothetical protein